MSLEERHLRLDNADLAGSGVYDTQPELPKTRRLIGKSPPLQKVGVWIYPDTQLPKGIECLDETLAERSL